MIILYASREGESIFIDQLIGRLKKSNGDVYIQTHDFPDPDAVASAFGLYALLKKYNIDSQLFYHGFIQRQALNRMISQLQIPLRHHSAYMMSKGDKVILIDGNKGNGNVSQTKGEILAVVDHHRTDFRNQVELEDIRSDYGSCSTIVAEYWENKGLHMPEQVATGLIIGIARDTDNFKRMITTSDIKQFQNLWPQANQELYYKIIRNNIEKADQLYYRIVMNTMEIQDRFAYAFLPDGCPTGMMGILGDFLLSMDSVDFTLIAAQNEDCLNLSVRSEIEQWNAAGILQEVLKDIGWGGGHQEMAGGQIPKGDRDLYERVLKQIQDILAT